MFCGYVWADRNEMIIHGILVPTHSLIIYGEENEELGRISWDKGYLEFTGRANESAKVFFESFLKSYVDQYIKERLKCED
jgi:hypothetical protein